MKLRQLATFAATFVISSAALAALAVPNPSLSDLTGSFRLNVRALADTSAERSAVDGADKAMGAEYKSVSKGLKKAASAMTRLDKAFGKGDTAYDEQADFVVSLLQSVTGTQLGLTAAAAMVDDIGRSPLRFAKLIQKNSKELAKIDLTDARSKISRAKTRGKRLKLLAKAAKKFEKLIKKYGRNNQAF